MTTRTDPRLYVYRGYELRHVGPAPIPGGHRFSWEFSHVDYDGPEDTRHGHAASMADAMAAVDELIGDELDQDATG